MQVNWLHNEGDVGLVQEAVETGEICGRVGSDARSLDIGELFLIGGP